MAGTSAAKPKRQHRRDWGKLLALVLCFAFAFLGAVPLAFGFLVRTEAVRSWAARKTSALLASELGVSARYRVAVQAWPLMIGLEHLVIDASDGGPPFLEVEQISVRPRLFSLLSGDLDVGDVEIIGPRIHAVVARGNLENLALKPRAPSPPRAKGEPPLRAPLASIAITDAQVDAVIDGTIVVAREVDVDISADGDAFEVAVRAGKSSVTRVHPFIGRENDEDTVDEDVICKLDTRIRVEPDLILVRRLGLDASVDFDPEPGTQPSCLLPPSDWRKTTLYAGALRIGLRDGAPVRVSGRIDAHLPAALVHRFVDAPRATGSIGLDAEIEYEARAPLPRITGHLSADSPGIDGKLFSKHLEADIGIAGEAIGLSHLEAAWGDGTISIHEAKIEPFAKGTPLSAGPIDIQGIEFPALLRDLGVHPQAHVAWSLHDGHLPYFKGTLSPVSLEGPIALHTRGFEVFDRPTRDPARRHMMGVKEATVRGSFQVHPNAVVLSNFALDTPSSHLRTTVSLGFASVLDLEVFEGSRIDLAEISPLAAITMGGETRIHATAHGRFEHPIITGDLAIDDFSFGGMNVGAVEHAKAVFEPMALDLSEIRLKHGQSRIRSPKTRIDFGAGADVVVDADVDTREGPHLSISDFFEIFHFDKDPRFGGIAAIADGTAHVHYVLGGHEDRCGDGRMDVRTEMRVTGVSLFGEKYDDGYGDVTFLWDDMPAGANGMEIDVRSATLRKDRGTVVASGTVRHGGVLRMSATGSGIPLGRLDMLGPAGRLFDGTLSFVADLGGRVSALETTADVDISRVRIGPSSLPPSRLRLTIEPAEIAPPHTPRKTRCDNVVSPPFDRAEFDRDLSAGYFRAKGELAGGQIALYDARISQQKHKVLSGKIGLVKLDLGTLANLIPGVAFAESAPKGTLSADLEVKSLPMEDPKHGEVLVKVGELLLERDGQRLLLSEPSGTIALKGDDLAIPDLHLEARTRSGLAARFSAGGAVHTIMSHPELDLGLRLDPLDLSRIEADIPAIARASGTVDGQLRVTGAPSSPHYTGAVHLKKGELALRGSPIALGDMFVDVDISSSEVRLTRAVATVGGGTVSVKASMPVHGLDLGTATATITARGLKLPVADGVDFTADGDLEASYRPGATPDDGAQKNLPDVKGAISLTSFSYTRPITMSLNLSQLTGKGQRTHVETYDPNDDFVRFHVTLVSPKPLRFSNNLVDMQLELTAPGVVLSGTNQRFGAQGALRILADSKLKLGNNEFEVREGMVRFDDPARITPKVDVRAVTEYRRAAEQEASAAAAPTSGGGGTTGTNTGGQWRISMHAHGEPENLKVEMTSDPPLGQDDIVLLLTLGMTRAEMDRGLASSLGQTVGLEALSQLTGADKAVKTVVPLIDEFHFGTGYSSRTGRTEPTVTVGKRITEGVRANVTTGLTENREVRSSLEWRLNRRMSVQGSYDNVNDVSSSTLGNVGADLRWRLEFE